jgi:hypothetical protein
LRLHLILRHRTLALVLGSLPLAGILLWAQQPKPQGRATSGRALPALWRSATTGKEYRVQVDKDRFYAEWVNIPPESAKHGAFIRSECHRVGSKWIGTSSVRLPCAVGEGAKEHIGNTCRLQLRIEIDSIGPDRIVGHGETLRRFDCQSCRVDEAGWGEFVWVPKKPQSGGKQAR